MTFTEFQKLKKIIVGKTYDQKIFDYHKNQEFKNSIQIILHETNEQLNELEKLLKTFDIEVIRPDILVDNFEENISLPWNDYKFMSPPLMPRDVLFVYGNLAIDMFTKHDNRQFEHLSYKKNWIDDFVNLSMPQPKIEKNKNVELYFDAANMIKLGKHILISQSIEEDEKNGKGNLKGKEWIKNILPKFYDCEFVDFPIGGHIDGKICLVKPGLLITWNKDWIPEQLKNWDVILIEEFNPLPNEFLSLRKQHFYGDFIQKWLKDWVGYVDETVFDVNALSIDENNIIFTHFNKKVFDQLEKFKVNPIIWNFKHQYFWDGGIHCCTQDIARVGEMENYL
jgi:N-dimethylarginine dimethylaminohydrolase